MRHVKKFTAKVIAVAMVVLTAAGLGVKPEKQVNAAELSSYLNVEYGIKYTGETDAKANSAGSAWDIQYFNAANSAYKTGDIFYVSVKLSGVSNFKQAAIQTSVNNWDWSSAPKKWSDDGIADGTVVAGKVAATQNGDNVSFKIQLDNAVDAEKATATQKVTLTDLFIMPMGNEEQETVDLPESKLLDLGTKYEGIVTAEKNADNDQVYEAQYFNVKDSAFSEGDTYIISYKLSGATQFKQVATQTSLTSWDWDNAVKVWAGSGLPDGQESTGAVTATRSGDGVAFKVRLDTLVDADSAPGESVDIKLSDLMVVKVANNDVVTLPSDLMISKDRVYAGSAEAVKSKDGSWNVEYFNVKDSAFSAGDLIEISFEISGASAFKQLVLQSNLDGWGWDSAPKTWVNNGIADGTKFSAVIKATKSVEDGITFKLWLDNPVDADFDKESVAVELDNLQVRDFASAASLKNAYKGDFTVGAAVSADKMDDAGYAYRAKEVFGTLTAENAMKPDALLNQKASQESADGTPVLNLEYSGMTKILDFAKENNMTVRGHALVYAAQTPDWFFKEGYKDDGKLVSRAVMTARLRSYIQQVVQFVETNYPGIVTCWDVVNEALDNDGSYVANNWTATIGDTYVAKAFEFADQYVEESGVKLYYNDYNMESTGKRNQVLALKVQLDEEEIRMDGVGMQEHATLTYPSVDSIRSAITAYAGASLDVQITELDVQIDESDSLETQADRYGDLFTLFKEKSDSISNVTVWGINDGDSWKNQQRPLLFFDDLSPKPAFDTVLNVAKSEVTE